MGFAWRAIVEVRPAALLLLSTVDAASTLGHERESGLPCWQSYGNWRQGAQESKPLGIYMGLGGSAQTPLQLSVSV